MKEVDNLLLVKTISIFMLSPAAVIDSFSLNFWIVLY